MKLTPEQEITGSIHWRLLPQKNIVPNAWHELLAKGPPLWIADVGVFGDGYSPGPAMSNFMLMEYGSNSDQELYSQVIRLRLTIAATNYFVIIYRSNLWISRVLTNGFNLIAFVFGQSVAAFL